MQLTKLLLWSLALLLAACMPIQPSAPAVVTSTAPADSEHALVNTQWQLVSFGPSEAETPVAGAKPLTLEFRPDGQVVGSGGCNSFGGQYQVQGATLAISQVISTKMACVAQGVAEQESRYFQALEAAGEFTLADNHLTIQSDNGQSVLNFTLASSAPTPPVNETPTITATVAPSSTLSPAEPPERVNFTTGATTIQLASLLPSGPGLKQYVLAASANQTMTVDATSDGAPLSMTIESPDGMRTIPEMMPAEGGYRIGHQMTVPQSGDYLVTLGKGDHSPSTNYTITFMLTTTTALTATLPPAAEYSLTGTVWTLSAWGMPGAETAVTAPSITLEFPADGQVRGSSGCNTYSGTYTVQNNTIAFGELISTLKACTDEQVMQAEQEYLTALKTAGEFVVTGPQLTIQYDAGSKVLNFISAVASASALTTTTAAPTTQPTVQFKLDNSVAHSYTLQTIPAAPPVKDAPYWAIYPAYTQITLTNYSVTNTLQRPQIFIYPAKAYAAMNEPAATRIAALQTLLKTRPTVAVDEKLTFLPLFNAAQVFHAQFSYMDFASGAGVRFLTQYDQAMTPINNTEMFYTFQGLTADNAYYVAALFPVTYPELPADGSALPPDFMDNFDQYLATTMQQLNTADAARFTPDLTRLDALIASLSIQ